MKVFCITQARMGSSRLPGKVMQLIHGRPMLEYHIMRVQQSKLIDSHIVATTTHDRDQPIVEYCDEHQYTYFCGDEDDVLGRFYNAAKEAGAVADDLIIRLTGDCPLVSGPLIDELILMHHKGHKSQYSHVSLNYFPRGFDAEIFSMQKLTEANRLATTVAQREHVTLYMYTQKDALIVPLETGKKDWSTFRLCVDEVDDMHLVDELIKRLGERWLCASTEEICQLLVDNKQLAKVNQSVRQRTTH